MQEVECLGACVNAPMMQVNNEWFYEDLTPENTVTLLENMAKGEGFVDGPQNGRINSEGPDGRTSLTAESMKSVNLIHSRDFSGAKQQWEDEKAAAAEAAKAK